LVGASAVLSVEDRLHAQQHSANLSQVQAARVRGAALSYIDHGTVDPVIFVHGSLGDHETFRPQFEPFARH
jgi:pimeloyl-ACP methyl ester carboxylesterase